MSPHICGHMKICIIKDFTNHVKICDPAPLNKAL